MRRARRLIEQEMSTLVIHLDDRSTDFLKAIYAGNGYPVITDASDPHEVAEAIKAHSRVFLLGHGSPGGLFGRAMTIDDRFGPLLAEKRDSLYIWCNADAYAQRNGLSGLVSGMFISEVGEARLFGINASQDEVDASNAAFSRIVREMLDTGRTPEIRQCYGASNDTCLITKFNSDRLYIFDNGSPTPALHSTSAGLPAQEEPSREKLDDKEIQWLEDYIASAAQAIIDKKTSFEEGARAIVAVIDEFLPGVDTDWVIEDLKGAMEILGDFDTIHAWAGYIVASLDDWSE